MADRFLPGVPGREIEEILNAAPGNEIKTGKFDNPASSAALAANTFGFFLKRTWDLPPLPDCGREAWPARSLSVRFPWSGGRHPVLDCLVTTPSALIGIESKRFEPFRDKNPLPFPMLIGDLAGGSHERLRRRPGQAPQEWVLVHFCRRGATRQARLRPADGGPSHGRYAITV